MFEKNEKDEIPFENALKCVISTYTDKIISSDSDLLAVCFYGTVCCAVISVLYILTRTIQKEKKNLNDFPYIYVLQDLDAPDAQRILDLENLLSMNSEILSPGIC